MLKTHRRQSAFTLFSIIISLTLISLLLTVSVINVPLITAKARDSRRKADLNRLKTALEEYYNDHQKYPDELPDCNSTSLFKFKMPCDPVTGEPYFYEVKKNSQDAYRIYSYLEYTSQETICPGGCGLTCEYDYGIASPNTSLNKCTYACGPGGNCQLFLDYEKSQCPEDALFYRDSTCGGLCGVKVKGAKDIRCKNDSGKNISLPNSW